MSSDFTKSPQSFGVEKNVGVFNTRLPSDSGEWFYGQGKIVQSTLYLTPIIFRVFIRSNGWVDDPLTHGLLAATIIMALNEDVLKLLFFGILLRKYEKYTGNVISRK